MAAERRAEVTWRGSLMEGSGTIESTGSGAFGGLEVTWASRSEPPSRALIALCSAPWYWNTRLRSGRSPISTM